MRKKALLPLLIGLLASSLGALADTKSPYKVDFNTKLSTSAKDFKVASGWGHIANGYWSDEDYETYYPTYSYSSSEGINGSGCLKVGTQTAVGGAWSYDTGKTEDLLVTPPVTGTVSVYVRKTAKKGTVKFYTVTQNGNKLAKGEEITVTLPELSTSEYVKVELPVQTNEMLGIWGSEVYIDDFEAESAEVELTRALKITKAPLLSSTSPDCDSEGNFAIKMSVSVTNTGEVDLAPGDEGYSLSIVADNTGAALCTQNIEKTLAVGASDEFEIECTANISDYAKRQRYDAKENIGGTTVSGGWIEPVAYVPKLVVKDQDDRTLEDDDVQDFGLIKQYRTKEYTLQNRGAAPLNVTALTLPDGFVSSLEVPFTVEAKKDTLLKVTLTTDVPGTKDGSLVIQSEKIGDFTLPLKGRVADPSKFLADFEDGQMPAGSIIDPKWSIKEWPEEGNSFVAESGVVDGVRMILPLLEVAEGDSLTFDAAKRANTSYVSIYYSPDRKQWTLAKEVKAQDMSNTKIGSSGSNYALTTFVVKDIPAGRHYIAVESGYGRVDDIYGYTPVPVEHDIMFERTSLPATGMVNKSYNVKAVLLNVNAKAETDCVAELRFGDEIVDSAALGDIAGGEQEEVTFSYTPHQAGLYKASVLFKSPGYTLSGDTVDVVISEEKAEMAVTVGTPSSMSMDVPLSLNYKHSETETIYTAAQLGLKEGDKISRIVYNGYNDVEEMTANVTIWLENTEDEAYVSPYESHVTDTMTKAYEGDYTFKVAGTKDEPQELLAVDLADPFTYTGKNLRIIVRSSSDTYKKIYFQMDNTDTEHAILRRNDTSLENGSFGAKQQAVVMLYVGTETNMVGGMVVDTHGFAVPQANVRLLSGDVLYTGKADNTGRYEVNVIQTGKQYALLADAEGFTLSGDTAEVVVDANVTDARITMAMQDAKFTVGAPAMVCLPIALEEEETKQAGKFYELYAYADNTVTLQLVNATVAGVPYVFLPAVESPFMGMADYEITDNAGSMEVDGIELRGTYGATVLTSSEVESYYVVGGESAGSASFTPSNNLLAMPFSAYFLINGQLTELPRVVFDETVSGISAVGERAHKGMSTIYTLDGRAVGIKSKVKTLRKGVYIVNGKKLVIK